MRSSVPSPRVANTRVSISFFLPTVLWVADGAIFVKVSPFSYIQNQANHIYDLKSIVYRKSCPMPTKIIPLPTLERVRQLFDYNPETGSFRAKTSRPRCRIGSEIGTLTSEGRKICRVDTTIYYVHRLIWLHYYGTEPPLIIDHMNGDAADNRIANLRSATCQQNSWNQKGKRSSKSGVKGAHWSSLERKWRSSMKRHGKCLHLGWFDTKGEAAAAYEAASRTMQGEYSVFERPS